MIEPNVPPAEGQTTTNPIQHPADGEVKEPLLLKETILDIPQELVFQQDHEQPAFMFEAKMSGYDKLSSVKRAHVKQKFSFWKS